MKEKILMYVLQFITLEERGNAITMKQRQLAYRNASKVEHFKSILEGNLRGLVNRAGLKAATMEQLQFQRGAIYAYQQILSNMKIANDALQKEEVTKN